MFFVLSKQLWSLAHETAWTVILVGGALALSRRQPVALLLLSVVPSAVLGALTLPPVTNAFERAVDGSARTTVQPGTVYDAAVVLGGDPARVVAGAELVRSGQARRLLYSGHLDDDAAAWLTSELVSRGVPREAIVIERRSRNTRENAVESARVVAAHGWESLVLVTSAAHMERASGCFRRVGLRPDTLAVPDLTPLPDRWPRRAAWERSKHALHEVVGRVVYRLVGYSA